MVSVQKFIDKIDYSEYSNKELLTIPLTMFGLAVVVILSYYLMFGSPVVLGIEFIGGSEVRVSGADSASAVSSAFSTTPSSIQSVPSDNSYIVQFREDTNVSQFSSEAEAAGLTVQSSSQISPTFGSDSQMLTIYGLLFAFVSMGVLVYGLFRTSIPSIAVISSAISDIIVPVAVMNLVGIELTLGTVAALLMLIGYSVDSDMLLNDYVVRRGGEFYDSVYEAMDTGITMTLTSLVAMWIMAISAYFLGVPLLRDIGFVIGVGLIVDLINTYLMNVSILRWYRFKAGGS